MFMLVKIHRHRRTGKVVDNSLIEDGFSTIDEAREYAGLYAGPGEFAIASLSRSPGNRIVERFRQGTAIERREVRYA